MVGCARTLDWDEVADCGADHQRPRRKASQQLGIVDAVAQRAIEDLFGVGYEQGFGLLAEAGYGAHRRGRLDARLEGRELERLHAAAGVAGHRNPIAVDLGPRLEIVNRSYRIPNAILHQVEAQQVALVSQHAVFLGAEADQRPVVLSVPKLDALALADGVPGEHDEARTGHDDGEFLILLVSLALAGVAGREDHGRQASCNIAGAIEIGRHVELGAALVDDPLDQVPRTLDRPDLARMERRALLRHRPPHLGEPIAHLGA